MEPVTRYQCWLLLLIAGLFLSREGQINCRGGLGMKNALPHSNQLRHPQRSWRHSPCGSGVWEYARPVEIGTIVSGAFAQGLAIIGCEDGSIAYEPKA